MWLHNSSRPNEVCEQLSWCIAHPNRTHTTHGPEGEENDGSHCIPPQFAVTTAAHLPEQLQETQILWPLFSNDNNMPRQLQFLPWREAALAGRALTLQLECVVGRHFHPAASHILIAREISNDNKCQTRVCGDRWKLSWEVAACLLECPTCLSTIRDTPSICAYLPAHTFPGTGRGTVGALPHSFASIEVTDSSSSSAPVQWSKTLTCLCCYFLRNFIFILVIAANTI